MNTLHLPEDLWEKVSKVLEYCFHWVFKRIFLLHPKCFHHFRTEKCLPQLGGIMFTFLCFPISFLSYSPPQKKLSSLLSYWKPALHTFFFLFASFCPPLLLLSNFPFSSSLLPVPHHFLPSATSSTQSPAPSAAAGPSTAGKCPPLPWEEVAGLGGLVSPGEIYSSNSCMPACGCRDTQHHKSVLPLDLEDFVRVISGEIICSENICCHTISEQSRKKGSSSPQIVSL